MSLTPPAARCSDPAFELALHPGETLAVRPPRSHFVRNDGDSSVTFLVLQSGGEYDCGAWAGLMSLRDRINRLGDAFYLLDFFGEDRNSFEKIPNDAIVGNVEDWSFRIFVDGDNRSRVFHTNQMLDGA